MRKDNWTKILNESLKEAEQRDFAWGEFDCFFWTAWMVERLTGKTPAEHFCKENGIEKEPRPYMSTKGMQRTLKKLGFDRFLDLVCAVYGEPVNIKKAQRGDLVMVQLPEVFMPTLGICRGVDAMFKTREGNTYYPISECTYAWRVV